MNRNSTPYFEKKIKVINVFGDPMENVEIVNLTTNQATITNANGVARVLGRSNDDVINFHHVSMDDAQFKLNELPQQVELVPHSLDEVFISDKPKKANLGWIPIVIGAGLLINQIFNSDKKTNTPGLKSPVQVTL